ncbi:hypothetical protein BDZ89DRAFT_1056865 [Hymenopellis radicata]|nr:hypothetical protein BDZ89DRAFT_1056865 [Hymenopellis radicata]
MSSNDPTPPHAKPDYQPPPGRLGNLSIPQQHTLDKLKKEIKQEGWFIEERMDDSTLLRFLRARKFDVALAKKMLYDCEEWRKSFGVDDIVKNFDFKERAELDRYYPAYYHKTDKDGRPLYIESFGKLDIDAVYSIITPERHLKAWVLEYEKLLGIRFPACSKAVGHPIETSCSVLDLYNVSLGQFYRVKDHLMAATSIGQNRYPETMGKFYIINAPWAFSAVWRLIRPWLDEVTVNKIDIIGYDYKDKLLAQIPLENLPKEFGGLCECAGGCSMSDAGPWHTDTHKHP